MVSKAEELGMALREGLRRLAKAVVVITCRHEGHRYAMAATAVSELSMDPPSLLICVNKTASLYSPLSAGAGFCVNILHHSQEHVAVACSGKIKGEARFEIGEWENKSLLELPCLVGSQASFFCENERQFEYGTHGVFIGRVIEISCDQTVGPLVYVDGRYTVANITG